MNLSLWLNSIKNWMNKPRTFWVTRKKGLKIEKDPLHVSQIFHWYDEDFAVKGDINVY